jgi:transcriptional regulator with XRE-family HTH domain
MQRLRVAPGSVPGGMLRSVSSERPSLSVIAAENIRAKRARLRITQREAAARAGVAASVWSVIESGQRRLTLDDAWRVCESLDMDIRDLLHGAPDAAARSLGL